ncbi:HAD-IA family hydrolase [Actinomyces bowdenii]|nr:HAD-IA family hydrolase [Actinomyces bowdenii]
MTPMPPAAADAPSPAAFPPSGAVRAVLLDADGVLQLIGTPWQEALEAGGGPDFAEALLSGEADALEGREDLRDLLARLIERLGLETGVEDLLDLWWRATPDPAAWQVVRDLRASGYLTVLATNQQHERRDWMRTVLGYDGLCDIDAYSCEVGAAKPDPAYFRAVLDLAGVGAGQALFVDDNAQNIAAARALGIRTIHHPADSGGQELRRELAEELGRV